MSTISPVSVMGDALPEYRGPEAWYGSDLSQRRSEWTRVWSDAELAEIQAAVDGVIAKKIPILDVGMKHFPLPKVAPVLQDVRREVLHGRGFVMLRGLPVERWSIEQAAVAYWGLGTYLGEPCSQNGKGHVLGHVKDLGRNYHDPLTRGYQTSARLPYHTDASDIVGLLCWRPGKEGGLSSIVSSTTVYNELLKRHPGVCRVLMEPFCRTRWGEVGKDRTPWSEVPVFMPSGDRLITSYVRSAITKGQLLDGVPKLTEEQIMALDTLDAMTENPALVLNMEFQPGDIQLLCNHSIMHGRTAYEDWPEPDRRRHLLRLWLACEDGPELPESFSRNYQMTNSSNRPNGVSIPGVPLIAPLEAA